METRITKLFNIDYPIIPAREIVAQYGQAVKRLEDL
jgi:hypothetical protein